ncbi:MAG: hypothetical protein ABSA94_19390 [Acidobacteriaceae bacterium]|jgi:hypothetical protein
MTRTNARIEDPHSLASVEPPESIPVTPKPERWLVFTYEPTALFSLKMSRATSSVGRTILVPTPYAAKMAFVDAAFKVGWRGDVSTLVTTLASVDLRIGVPEKAVVTHTIIKIRQEPKDRKSNPPYIPAVAYREFVCFRGPLRWAFDLVAVPSWLEAALIEIAPGINYVGKRGSFIQFMEYSRQVELGPAFTQPLDVGELKPTSGMHIAVLDDFGPEANFEALNSFSTIPIRRDKQRILRETLVPLGLVNVGPGFSEYSR